MPQNIASTAAIDGSALCLLKFSYRRVNDAKFYSAASAAAIAFEAMLRYTPLIARVESASGLPREWLFEAMSASFFENDLLPAEKFHGEYTR